MGGLGIMGVMRDMGGLGIMGLMGNASFPLFSSTPITSHHSHHFTSINLFFSRSNIPFRALRANCGEPVTFVPLCRRAQENPL